MRRRDVLLERVGLAGDGEEVEDPATVVVEQHDRQRAARAGGPRAARRCRGRARRRRSAARPARRPLRPRERRTPTRPCRRSRSRRGLRARAAASSRTGEELLDVADRHRGGDEQRRVGREPLRQCAGDERLRQLVAERRARSRRRRRRRRRARRRATRSSRRRAPDRRAARERRPDPHPDDASRGRARRRRDRTRSAARRSPASQARSGLEVGRSPIRIDELGPVLGGERAGRAAAGRSGRSRPSPRRAPDSGSASSGIPSPRGERGQPVRGRGVAVARRRRSRSAPDGGVPPAGGAGGAGGSNVDVRRVAGATGVVVGQRSGAIEHERLAQREVEVDGSRAVRRPRSSRRGRRASGSTAAVRAVASWTPTSKNHLTASP